MRKFLVLLSFSCFLAACAQLVPKPLPPSKGHITAGESVPQKNIPKLVEHTPVLPVPKKPEKVEKYTVVVNEVPVKELLFALARDADVNVDVDPGISGVVTLNAVKQTMDQILDRVARQVDLRYEYHGNVLSVLPDKPYLHTYQINYINQSREMKGDINLNTSISAASGGGGAGGGGGGGGAAGGGGNQGTGATNITVEAKNDFWKSLVTAVKGILGQGASNSDVIAYPESGMLLVKATSRKQKQVQALIDQAVQNARRQVLIQVTIAEVTLNNQFQAGIDWSFLTQAGKAGFSLSSVLLPATPADSFSHFVLNYNDPNTNGGHIINAQIRLLQEFGNVSILSSPQIIALNNQTAVLKVVDDIVYFQVKSTTTQSQTNTLTSFDTTPKTVSVGVSMSVTPQINANDSVILNIRPSISRVLRFVPDPNPALTISSGVPELRVREMETLLQVNSGQIAVLGGLMENQNQTDKGQTPAISELPVLGDLFKSHNSTSSKTELVIFLRPQVIHNPSLNGDFKQYKTFLQRGASPSGSQTGS